MDTDQDLRDRMLLLEKKIDEQNDEIVCLRSTLADALRRLDLIESFRGAASGTNGSSSNPATTATAAASTYQKARESRRERPRSYVGRSQADRTSPSVRSSVYDIPYSTSTSPAPCSMPSHDVQSNVDNGRHVTIANGAAVIPIGGSSGLHAAKRWSSTSDFGTNSNALATRRAGSSSLLNLNAKQAPKASDSENQQPDHHGIRQLVFVAEDGVVKFNFRGRLVSVWVPSPLIDSYKLSPPVTAPKRTLKMEWVYGYRGKDSRANLFVLPTGELIYYIASVVVLFNVDEQSQRFYLGHTTDVKCLVVHPNKLLIASGQSAGNETGGGKGGVRASAHIRIWNSVSLQTVCVIGLGDFEKSISCLAFSKVDGGNILLVIDDSPDSCLSLWEWQKGERGTKICETKISTDLVVAAEWNPLTDWCSFVTCGKGHVNFWFIENGSISRKLGLFETRDKPKYVTCLVFADNGDLITGDSNGTILVWPRGSHSVSRMIRNAHTGPIFALLPLKDGRIVSGGGKDGQLLLWDFPSYRRMGYVAEIPEEHGAIRTMTQGKDNRMFIGTTRNCIVAGFIESSFRPVVVGHTDELWALCVHPNQPQFLSCGYDKRLRLWDTMTRSAVWSEHISEPVQAACFSPGDGAVVALGTTSGTWIALDTQTRDVYATQSDGTEAIQVMRYSPDGKLLAVGSRNNMIYIYQVMDNYRKYDRIGRCVGHSSWVTHIDWSRDSVHLRTNAGDYELLFWNAGLCRQITQMSLVRDIDWATTTCPLSYQTLGILPEGNDGTEIVTCASSASGQLIASGDDAGRVKLFSCPVPHPKSHYHAYAGHSSPVTNVAFLHDDTRIISSGGKDSSIIQWAVV